MISNFMQNLYFEEIQIVEWLEEPDEKDLIEENLIKAIIPKDEYANASNLSSTTYLEDVFTTKLSNPLVTTMKILLGKTFNINSQLSSLQQWELMNIVQIHNTTFDWEYQDMKGIDPNICRHHVYTVDNLHPIQQP